MFNWIAKKYLSGEIESDLKGLESLPTLVRFRTTLEIFNRIDSGLSVLDRGESLRAVQNGYSELRRQAVKGAKGYDDPRHLIGSIPEHFFNAFSKEFSQTESATSCKKIFNKLREFFLIDVRLSLEKNEIKNAVSEIEKLERRLVSRRII